MRYFKVISLLIVVATLSSCSIQNKFAASFGKRRYNKGFYVDFPGKINFSESKVAAHPVPIHKTNSITVKLQQEKNISGPVIVSIAKPVVKATICLARKEPPKVVQNRLHVFPSAKTIAGIESHHYTAHSDESNNITFTLVAYFCFLIPTIIMVAALAAGWFTAYSALVLVRLWFVIEGVALVCSLIAILHEESSQNLAILVLVLSSLLFVLLGIIAL